MTYIATTPIGGLVNLTDVVAVSPALGQPGIGSLPSIATESQFGTIVDGYDGNLGGGEFAFYRAAAGITAGNVVELVYTLTAGNLIITATPWTGTANSGKPLAVALSTLTTGQAGWFQISGAAITTTNGTITNGNPVYYQANGTVSNSAVAGKQMVAATAASANGATIGSGTSAVVLSATQALVYLSRPSAQDAIT